LQRLQLVSALLLIAQPASAASQLWVDIECGHVLVANGDGFLFQAPGAAITTCKPVNSSAASGVDQLECDSGLKAEFKTLNDRTVVFNDVEMNLYDGPLPCGAGGVEWPD